jgi:hypothetical protein
MSSKPVWKRIGGSRNNLKGGIENFEVGKCYISCLRFFFYFCISNYLGCNKLFSYMHIARDCSTYDKFLSLGRLLTDKLMLQGFLQSRLMSAFRKFYGRYNNLLDNYKLSLSHMLSDIFYTNIDRPYFAHWLLQWITLRPWSWNCTQGGCDWSTGGAYWSHLQYISGSVLAHLFLWFVIPTFEADLSLVS